MALLKALTWIKKDPNPTLICTDSMSLHQALDNTLWRSKDDGVNKIRQALREITCQIVLLWVPSHCGLEGNERADVLAEGGTKLSQKGIPVSEAIVKAKIKARKWQPTQKRPTETYKERRASRKEIEAEWPRRVRTAYARMRTGHSKRPKQYRYVIEQEDDAICKCGQVEETIEHILCNCEIMAERRAQHFEGAVSVDMLVTQPERC